MPLIPEYCPLCGEKGEWNDGYHDYFDCEDCGEIHMEVWTYNPHRHS